MRTLVRRRRLVLLAAVLIVVAGSVAAYAYFTSSGAGAGSASTGTLTMTSSRNGSYVVSFVGQYPGASQSGNVTITNSGSVPATAMTLTFANPSDQTCAQNVEGCLAGAGTSTDLSGDATVTVRDTTTSTIVVPATTLDVAVAHGVYSVNGTAGSVLWAPGEAHTFQMTVAVPSSASNAYQGTSMTFDVNFGGRTG